MSKQIDGSLHQISNGKGYFIVSTLIGELSSFWIILQKY